MIFAALVAAAVYVSGANRAGATTLFADGFETGVSGSRWEVMKGNANYQILFGDGSHSFGTQSARQEAADPFIYYMRSIAGAHPTAGIIAAGDQEILTTYLWDDGNNLSSGPQTAAGVMLSSPSDSGGAADDFYQINVNSTVRYNNYNWRTALDGTIDSGVARSQGWHKMQIAVGAYTGSVGDVKFYIDDALVGSGRRKPGSGSGDVMDEVRLGISIKTPGSAFWYDNVDLSVVPEPVLALGVAPAFILIRRRRVA
jgi:hypothetical protein